jgi:hypothetical protein
MLSRIRSLWRNLLHRGAVERDLDDELTVLHAELIDEKIRAGMRPDAARRAATIELGHVHIVKQHVRDARAGAFWDAFVQDARYGARQLRRNPLFTATAMLSLAIGVGANTTIFSLPCGTNEEVPMTMPSQPSESLAQSGPARGRRARSGRRAGAGHGPVLVGGRGAVTDLRRDHLLAVRAPAPDPRGGAVRNGFRQLSGVDRIIHEPARLVIVSLLYAVEEADFVFLQRESELTRGTSPAISCG